MTSIKLPVGLVQPHGNDQIRKIRNGLLNNKKFYVSIVFKSVDEDSKLMVCLPEKAAYAGSGFRLIC